MSTITREQVDELLYRLLREIHLFEYDDMVRFGLSWRDMHILKYLLVLSNCRISEIASEMHLPLFAVSRLVNSLHDRGLVKKDKDAADKRNTYVSLTAQGREYIQNIQEYHFDMLVKNLGHLEATVVENLLVIIPHISKLLKRPGDVMMGGEMESVEHAEDKT